MDQFRDYSNCDNKVVQTYKENHEKQTVAFVKQQLVKHCQKFDKAKMSIWQAIDKLSEVIDESDPDLDLPQIIHAFQVAEGLRKAYPEYDWLPLIGLIHDLGKIISLPEFGNQEQWCSVGDIYPVGCQFSQSIIFHQFFENNPDSKNPDYNTEYGMYKPNCGISNMLFSFGHDEYMYQVLKHNKCKIPELGLSIIRYHSFYPWHKQGAYTNFMNEDDYVIREWCSNFSKFDLYTKSNDNIPNIDELRGYYDSLINKYFDNPILEW